jgi:hypothetical protein
MYGEYSRYKHSTVIRRSDDSVLYYSLRPRPWYVGGLGETLHKVQLGDTLMNLAQFYFKGFPDPARLWWIIADYQPEPINDPTIVLTPGSVVVIPPQNVVQDWLMSVTDGVQDEV